MARLWNILTALAARRRNTGPVPADWIAYMGEVSWTPVVADYTVVAPEANFAVTFTKSVA